jgi:hypothetical protein
MESLAWLSPRPHSANRGCPAETLLNKSLSQKKGGYGFEMAGLCCGRQRWVREMGRG